MRSRSKIRRRTGSQEKSQGRSEMGLKVLPLWVVRAGAVLLMLQLSVSTAAAWGADGHHMVCQLAEPLFAPVTLERVRSLLPDYANGSLASLCTWPDDIRWMWKWQWSSPLHYIDTPDFYCNYNYSRDCHNSDGVPDMCVSGAISNYSSQLRSYQNARSLGDPPSRALMQLEAQYNLTEALLFLAHFVGDIHQPLHVAFTADEGGNTIILHWYTRKYNLHHVWDNEFINRARDYLFASNLTAFTEALAQNISTSWAKEAIEWAKCPGGPIPCPDLYASESISLACKWAYRNATPGSTLEDEYFLSRLPIVEGQLARGGVRLAAILNNIFSEG